MAAVTRVMPVLAEVTRTRRVSMTANKIYKGTMVVHDDSDSDRVAEGTDVSGDKFAGFALETVDNSGGSSGDKDILVARKGKAWVIHTGTTVGVFGWQGDPVYIIDGETVGQDSTTGGTGAATNDNPCGRQIEYQNVEDPLGRSSVILIEFDADDQRVS